MYNYQVQQYDLDLLSYSSRSQYVKIELLDHSKQNVLDTVEGQLISDNFSADGDSATRRTYSATLFVSDLRFFIDKNSRMWIDKYVRVYYGLQINSAAAPSAPIYYQIGTFSFVDLTYSYNATTKQLSISCQDLMADYDGTKGGVVPTSEWTARIEDKTFSGDMYIKVETFLKMVSIRAEELFTFTYDANHLDKDGNPYPIWRSEQGVNMRNPANYGIIWDTAYNPQNGDIIVVRLFRGKGYTLIIYRIDPETITPQFPKGIVTSIYTAIENSVKAAGITDYEIEDIGKLVPYDLEFDAGATWKDVWQTVTDLYPDCEFFFDENGKYIWRQIPTAYSDPRLITSNYLEPVVISEQINNSYSKACNATEVWGMVLDLSNKDRYAYFDEAAFRAQLTAVGFDGLPQETMDFLKNIEAGHTDLYNARINNQVSEYLNLLFGDPYLVSTVQFATTEDADDTLWVNLVGELEQLTDLANLVSIGIKIPGVGTHAGTIHYIKVNNFDPCPIYTYDTGELLNRTYIGGRTYVFRFRLTADGDEVSHIDQLVTGNGIINSSGEYEAKTAEELDEIRENGGYGDIIVYKNFDTGEIVYEIYPSGLRYLARENPQLLNFACQGEDQCFAKYVEENNEFSSDLLYSVDNVGYEILSVKNYSNLAYDELCFNQAEYETYYSCVKQDTITIQTIIIPWLEPHQKIQYRLKMTNELSDWLIKSLSWDTKSGTMSITMYRFIPAYQYIWDRKYRTYWHITYNLDGGGYDGEGNVDEYCLSDLPIELVQPVRSGYTFTGWTSQYLTDKGYDGPQPNVTIAENTTGDLEFTANWQPN